MVSDGPNNKNVTSGSLAFILRSGRLVEIVVPVAESKVSEAQPMIEDLYELVIKHYYGAKNLSPRDVTRILMSVASAVDINQMKLTEDKYNGKASRPRI